MPVSRGVEIQARLQLQVYVNRVMGFDRFISSSWIPAFAGMTAGVFIRDSIVFRRPGSKLADHAYFIFKRYT